VFWCDGSQFRRNLPHRSPGFPKHSTLKLIYDGAGGKEVTGTMHVPGRNGKAASLWPGAGYKWMTRKVDGVFLPWGVIMCRKITGK
jgi:hypothetical protein